MLNDGLKYMSRSVARGLPFKMGNSDSILVINFSEKTFEDLGSEPFSADNSDQLYINKLLTDSGFSPTPAYINLLQSRANN